MSSTTWPVACLSELQDKMDAVCFAILAKKERKENANGHFYICHFKNKFRTLTSPIYSNHCLFEDSSGWEEGVAYRIACTGSASKYGFQMSIHEMRRASPEDEADGYDVSLLYETSRYEVEESYQKILAFLDKYVSDTHLHQLTHAILNEHESDFKRFQAAENIHHPFTGGLIEHIRSVARIAAQMADHYAVYYHDLNPPLNKSLIVAGAILHDIGKLREFAYDPCGARYTPMGRLVGHIILGRDMIREAAGRINGFPEETLLQLEHVILAHHGKPEYDSPRRPCTLEALLVHYADEIDAKMNCGVRALDQSVGDDPFTGRVYGWDNSRLYRSPKTPDAPAKEL